MAIITQMTKSDKFYQIRGRLTFCNAEYNEYSDNGEKYVRIQTFGSAGRQDIGKTSQVIHLNKETAKQLIDYLKQSFNI